MGLLDTDGVWGLVVVFEVEMGGWDVVHTFERGWGQGFVDEMRRGWVKGVVDADSAWRGSLSRLMWNATAVGVVWQVAFLLACPCGGLRFWCPRFDIGGYKWAGKHRCARMRH